MKSMWPNSQRNSSPNWAALAARSWSGTCGPRTHTSAWFSRIEELNDYVLYVADPAESGWTRQCCRQADVVLAWRMREVRVLAWPGSIAAALGRGARIELALLHEDAIAAGAATEWLRHLPAAQHHHIVDSTDMSRVVRLLTGRGVGLVLSGGGARGFAHLGVIRALREARIPLDFLGGASIGAIIAAGVAMGWGDDEMQLRYRRSFVDTNPVNDYTFPLVALTRGRKVSRLLQREYGDTLIEDLRRPFFCVSANLTTGRALEHREGAVATRYAPRSPFRESCRRCFGATRSWSTAPPSTICRWTSCSGMRPAW